MFKRMNSDLKRLIMVGIGGTIGAVGRYFMSLFILNDHVFPYATLLTNMIGCFLLSYLLHQDKIKQNLSPDMFAALTIGIIGSFTTFSTVTLETVQLLLTDILVACVYIGITLFSCLLFCYCGFKVATRKQGDI